MHFDKSSHGAEIKWRQVKPSVYILGLKSISCGCQRVPISALEYQKYCHFRSFVGDTKCLIHCLNSSSSQIGKSRFRVKSKDKHFNHRHTNKQ